LLSDSYYKFSIQCKAIQSEYGLVGLAKKVLIQILGSSDMYFIIIGFDAIQEV
jgi:hypothetical protein